MDWSLTLATPTGSLITGAAADTSIRVRRVADDYLLDWNDGTFKAAGWTTVAVALIEVSAVNTPGLYKRTVSEAAWADGDYEALVRYAPVGGTAVNGDMLGRVRDGKELVVAVADMVDAVDTRLPSDPADESAVEAAITAAVLAVQGVAGTDLADVRSDIAALNDLSSADAQAAAGAALTAYGAATGANVTAAVTAIQGGAGDDIADVRADLAALNDLSSADAQAAAAAALAAYGTATATNVSTSETNIRGVDSDTLKTLSDQIDGLPSAASIATDVWGEAVPGVFGAGTAGQIVGDNLNAKVGDVKTQTDKLTFSGSNVQARVADKGVLNDVSSSDVQTASGAALTAYDPPTKAELDAAVAPLATSIALATVDGIVDDILLDTAALDARVPSDPADESMLEAAITAATTPLATALAVAALPTDADVQAAASAAIAAAGLATAAALGVTDGKVDGIKVQTDKFVFTGSDVRATLDGETVAVASIAADAIDAAAIKADAITEIAGGVDAAVTASHGTGSYVDTGTGLTAQQVRDAMKLAPTAGAAATGSVDAHLDSIDAKTTNLPSDPADQSAVEAAITAAVAPLATATALATTDGKVTTIQGQTDQLHFAGDNVQARVADKGVLNDVSTAQVQTAAAAALTAYDPPTKAELDAAVAPLATATSVATLAADLALVKQVETGGWQIVANQMIFYAADGTTPLLTFDLTDDAGLPAMERVFRRTPA